MKGLVTKITIGILCLTIGALVVTQYRSQQVARAGMARSDGDQAAYISQLYESTTQLQQQADELDREMRQYQNSNATGKSNLDTMVHDLQNLRMANGEVEATGPGVTVTVDGNLTVFELEDLVNELRNASAEAIAVNDVRVVTRSSIVTDQNGGIVVDRQSIARPYRLEAIGEPDTLLHAVQRKGGLIALFEARNAALHIQVTKHGIADKAGWLKLPKTALDFSLVYGQPAP